MTIRVIPPGPLRELGKNSVHVWLVSVRAELAQLEYWAGLLAADEKTRAESFVFEKDRHRHLVTRGWLRRMLGEYLGAPPREIVFELTERGKPVLAGAYRGRLTFNLSHSSEYIMYAFSREREVGIDIERVKPFANRDLVIEQFFSPIEIREYFALPEAIRNRAFFAGWTRKEAIIKAIGEGFALPLDQFSVPMDPETRPGIDILPSASIGGRWTVRDLEPPNEDYATALAVGGGEFDLTCRQWRE